MSTNEALTQSLRGIKDKLSAIQSGAAEQAEKYLEVQKRLDRMEAVGAEKGGPAFAGGSDLPGAEEGFSFARTLLALSSKSWEDAPYELEVLTQAAKQKNLNVNKVKAATLGSDVTLGNLVPNTTWQEIVKKLRSAMIIDQIGVRRLGGLKGSSLDIRRQTGTGTAFWGAENATITKSDQQTDVMQLRPHKSTGMTEISNTLLRAGTPEVEEFVRTDLVAVIKRLQQTGFFAGSGVASQPTGMKSVTDIQSKAVGGAITAIQLMKLIEGLRNADVPEYDPSVYWVMHPAVLGEIEQLAPSDTTHRKGLPVLTQGDMTAKTPGRILGIPFATSTDIPVGDLFLAKWDQTVFADWGALDVAVSDTAGDAFDKDLTKVRVIQEVDYGCLQPAAVIYASGITASTAL